MTSKTHDFLRTKITQLKNRQFPVLYLGEEGKGDVTIASYKDLEKFSRYARLEIDNMLKYNKKIENWTIVLIIGLYAVGLAIILCGIFLWDRPVVTATGSIIGLGVSITWPIKKLLDIRDSNLHLQKFLLIIPLLAPEDAGEKAERILFGKRNRGSDNV